MEQFSIRPATTADTPRLMQIFAIAQQRMADIGNPHQWTDGYPDEAIVAADIAAGDCLAIEQQGRVVAVFTLHAGIDPTYINIYHGAWLNDAPYATIHRIASSGEISGIMHAAMCYAKQHYDNIRIDTHEDNAVMRHILTKEGFRYCGIIHCRDASDRLAYQWSV